MFGGVAVRFLVGYLGEYVVWLGGVGWREERGGDEGEGG